MYSLGGFRSVKHNLPMLKSLFLYSDKGTISGDTFADAPLLHTINIPSCTGLNIPYGQIRNATSHGSFADLLYLLHRAPSLAFQRYECDSLSSAGLIYVVSPLKTLILSSKHAFGDFFDFVTLPLINTLFLDQEHPQPVSPQSLISLLARSSSHLTKLILSCMALTDDDLTQCLRMTPSLVELGLQGKEGHGGGLSCVSNRFLIDLSVLNHGGGGASLKPPPLIPCLAILTLWGPFMFDASILVDMVMSRCRAEMSPGVQTLRKVHLHPFQKLDIHAMTRLEQLSVLGLDLVIEEVVGYRRRDPPGYWKYNIETPRFR